VGAIVVRPGEGMNIDPSSLSAEPLQGFVKTAEQQSIVGFLLHVIPDSLVGAFTGGDLLQVLFVAVLFGLALAICGDAAQPVVTVLNAAGKALFQVVHLIMRAAPIGALGAFAFTIGNYGIESIASLAKLVATVYATSAGFVVIVLGAIAALSGFSLFRLIVYLREEILLVLGTSSSESALPNLIEKLERAGCAKSIVGIVVPTGYSFNLDGTNIYLTLAAIFVAQATNTPLPLSDQVLLLVVAVLSSKGAAGVTGAGFVTLAATLSVVPAIPLAGLTLILGVDRFMSECRSVTNFIGNAVATIVVAKWEGRLDAGQLAQALAARPPLGPTPPPEPDLALASEQKP
jgi:aerobic C4-dicarboxylate transport protein